MTEVISFYAASRRLGKPADTPRPTGGPAQLLFFTGVRYERAAVDIQIEAQKKPRKRKMIAAADAAVGS